MQPKKLEHHKYFKPIAWLACIGFASYVGFLALSMSAEIAAIEPDHRTMASE